MRSISLSPSRLLAAAALCAMYIMASPTARAAEPAELDKLPPTSAGMKLPSSTLDLFNRIDKDQDGKLSKDEAKVLPAIAERFDELDKNKDGYLSLEEFASAVKPEAMK
jgi:hypothetical protein